MKKEFSHVPETIDEKELYGFSWMEHVTAIPSPLLVVTSYKENGKTNATMQSWSTFDLKVLPLYFSLQVVAEINFLLN